MYILGPRRLSLLPWLNFLSKIAVICLCAVIVYIGYVLFSFRDSPSLSREAAPSTPALDFRKIEKGLLALQDVTKQESSPLLRALKVRARNTRPDIAKHPLGPQMLLEIKGAPEPRAVSSGQKLYLHWEPTHAGGKIRAGPPAPLNWSAENSCFTLTPYAFPGAQDADAVFFQIVLTDESGQSLQETPFLIESVQDKIDLEENCPWVGPWLDSLRKAYFWTKDAFLELYGGKDKAEEVYKIAFPRKDGLNIQHVKRGDYLVFQEDHEEGLWTVHPLEAASEKPLAQVLAMEGGKLSLRVWDCTGFFSGVILLSSQPVSPITTKVEADFVSPRLRNSSEVSCLVGQRRVVLKPGDWWIKEENNRWRSIKKINEIDDFLAFKRKGEIFVVDALDKSQGKSMLKGRLFDQTRQIVQAVALPVAEGRSTGVCKQQKEARKKAIRETTKRAPVPIVKKGEPRIEVRGQTDIQTEMRAHE